MILQMLYDLNKQKNVTILMVKHDPIVVSYSDCTIFLRDGRLEHEIEQKEKDQTVYFQEIVDFNSKESMDFLSSKKSFPEYLLIEATLFYHSF